jgi:uncharacterized protein (TIGR02300 family)
VAKPEWGIKRICPNCGARYYDLRSDPPICPSCGTVFDPEALLKSRRARPAPVEELQSSVIARDEEEVESEADAITPISEASAGADDIDPAAETARGDEEDVLIEDASELGDEDVVDVDNVGEEEP